MLCLYGMLQSSAKAEHWAAPGTTRIARWKDDMKAAFTLQFDDGIDNHLSLVIPELQKRKMVGTFFLVPGPEEKEPKPTKWSEVLSSGVAVIGNHTLTHKGFSELAGAEVEIGGANARLLKMFPGKEPRLLAFAVPGVGPGRWPISGDQLKEMMKAHQLVDRGDFRGHGAMFHVRTGDEMVALADSALNKGGVEYIVFHSIGPTGTIPTPVPIFMDFLDKLETRRSQLWITDVVSAHQYESEREGGKVEVLESTDKKILLKLTSNVDAQLYDAPLTLITQIPSAWKRCQVTQANNKTIVTPRNNTVRFDAVPNRGDIRLEP